MLAIMLQHFSDRMVLDSARVDTSSLSNVARLPNVKETKMRRIWTFVLVALIAALLSPVSAEAQPGEPEPERVDIGDELPFDPVPDQEPVPEAEPKAEIIDGGEEPYPEAVPLPPTPEEEKPGWAASEGSVTLNPGQRKKIEGIPASVTARSRTFGDTADVV